MQNQQEVLGSPDRFGYEWANYSSILPEHRTQLQRWLGSTRLESFAGKSVLDVGCGMGRNPYWFATAGAKSVVGVDVDEQSLAAARKNLAGVSNARILKTSAYDLNPNVIGTFERVTSIGVVHHLADPALAIKKMWSCVASGGELILWCYGKEGNERILPLIEVARFLGSRLPLPVVHAIAKMVAAVLWPIFHLVPFKTEYYRNLKTLSFKNVESIIFDQMIPHIAHYWDEQEMKQLLDPLGGEVTLEHVQGNSWSARVKKQ